MLYLASRSPRRAELLRQIGAKFHPVTADIDETPWPGESPRAYVCRMAEEKARAGLAALQASDPPVVLGADTAVILGDEILGKPRDRQHAVHMLSSLSGRSHEVISAVSLAADERQQCRLQSSRVYFRTLATDEIEAYCRTAEPMDKAGAYAIQGYAAVFIERLEGSYSGVMGLPLLETWQLLKEFSCL